MTLVELLVVVAIILVLAALLFPAVGAMQRAANSATCVSNLNQIGAAIQLYATDHDGYLPGLGFAGQTPYYNRDPRQLQNSLLSYLQLPTPTTWSTSDLTSGPPNQMSYAKVFLCPGWKGPVNGKCYSVNGANGSVTLPNGSVVKPWGFMNNAAGAMSPPSMKIIQLADSGLSKIFAIRDGDFSATMPNHATYRNALFFDWHVGRLNFSNNPL